MYTDYELYQMFMGLKQEMKMYLDSIDIRQEVIDFHPLYAALYQLPKEMVEYLWTMYIEPSFEENGLPEHSRHEHIIDLLEKEYYINNESEQVLKPLSESEFSIMYKMVSPVYRVELGRSYDVVTM
jgi:hypothetical protein